MKVSGNMNSTATTDVIFKVRVIETSSNGDIVTFNHTSPTSIVGLGEIWNQNVTIQADVSIPIGLGVSVTFTSATGHSVGDLWEFVGVRLATVVGTGTEISIDTQRSGSPDVNQITLAAGYSGEIVGSVASYKVPPIFSVKAQTVDIYSFWTDSTTNSGTFKFTNVRNEQTGCLAWNARDYEIEEEINAIYTPECTSYNSSTNVASELSSDKCHS